MVTLHLGLGFCVFFCIWEHTLDVVLTFFRRRRRRVPSSSSVRPFVRPSRRLSRQNPNPILKITTQYTPKCQNTFEDVETFQKVKIHISPQNSISK